MDEIYRRADTGEEIALRDAPPPCDVGCVVVRRAGFPIPKRADGIRLVRCPGYVDRSSHADWFVDGEIVYRRWMVLGLSR